MTDNQKIKVLVVPSDRSGGVMYMRSTTPHQYLQTHYSDEFDCDIVYVSDFPRESLESFFQQYDLIVFHKQLDREGRLLDMIKFLDIPVVCDIDDSPVLTEAHPMYISWKKQNWLGTISKHLKGVDCVTTTTPIFAEDLKKYNSNVEVLPNAIDIDNPQFTTNKNPSEKIRFGLVCGSTHMKDIKLIQKLETLDPELRDKMQIVLCGADYRGQTTVYKPDGSSEIRNIRPEESIWCRYEEYLTKNYDPKYVSPEHKEFLKKYMAGVDDPFENEGYRKFCTRDIYHYGTHYENVDVLLAPLTDNIFNKEKSQLKFIEAGFTNTAVIASNFGPYTIDARPYLKYGGEIDPAGNCLLVDNRKAHKDWLKMVKYLLKNPEVINVIRDNLRKDMLKNYSLEKVTAKRAELYKKIVAEHKAKN